MKKPKFEVGDYVTPAWGFSEQRLESIENEEWGKIEKFYKWRKVTSVGRSKKYYYRLEGITGLFFEDDLCIHTGVQHYEAIGKFLYIKVWGPVLTGETLKKREQDLKDFSEGELTPSEVFEGGGRKEYSKKEVYNYLKEQMIMAKVEEELFKKLLKEKKIFNPLVSGNKPVKETLKKDTGVQLVLWKEMG